MPDPQWIALTREQVRTLASVSDAFGSGVLLLAMPEAVRLSFSLVGGAVTLDVAPNGIVMFSARNQGPG